MKDKMKGFTLVELLAVIAILGLVLIVAVPKINKTMNNSKKRTFEISAKSIAKSAEERNIENETYGINEEITCESVSNISKKDFSSCKIKFDEEGNATVTIVGAGSYEGFNICGGTKTEASATNEECSLEEENIEPGLYETGSNYKTLLKDWDTLIEEEIFYIDNGVLMYGEIAESENEDWNNALSGDLKLPDDGSIILIGEEAFAGASNLTGVIIPNSVISIGIAAFMGCTSLTSVTLSNNVTSIEYSTFGECTSLKSVTIPNSVTSIGEYVFSNCTSLTSIIIGNSVTSIGKVAFGGCTSLTDIYYTGKEEEWNSITIGSANEPLTTGTMHYEHVIQ